MNEDIIRKKLETALDFICQLYKLDIITGAYIVGSVAEGTARADSDIDLNIVSPKVPDSYSGIRLSAGVNDPNIQKIIMSITEVIGAKSNENYLIYGKEKFDIFIWNEFNPGMGIISISKNSCT